MTARPYSRGTVRTLIGAVLAGLFVGALVMYFVVDGDDDDAGAADQPSAVAEVARNPAQFYDRRLDLTGRVRDVLGSRAVEIGPERLPRGDSARSPRQLVVVMRRPLAALGARAVDRPLLRGDVVRIQGDVSVLTPEEVRKRTGFRLTRDLVRRRGQPALFADEVEVLQRLLPVAGTVSASTVALRPAGFIGHVASVRGEVTERFAGGAVLDDRLPVLLPFASAESPKVGARVSVTGPVKRVDRDQVPGPPGAFRDELFGRFPSSPLLVADTLAASG